MAHTLSYPLDEKGCQAHRVQDCLCDVHYDTPAPTNYHFIELKHAELVGRALNMDWHDIDGPTLARFLDALGYAHELIHAPEEKTEQLRRHKVTVDKVDSLLAEGHAYIDVPFLLGVEWETLNESFFRPNSIAYDWDESEFMRFESMYLHGVSLRRIADHYGCTVGAVMRLRDKLRLNKKG